MSRSTWPTWRRARACTRQAIETYDRAIALKPDLPAGYLGLGNTLKTVGRQAEAIAAYRRATVLRPEQSEAWWSLSNLKTFRFADAEIEAMQRQLESAALPAESRVQFSFALAKAREDAATMRRAFELYEQGNRTRRTLESYDPVQTEVINDRIIDVFDAGFLRKTRADTATRIPRRSSSSVCRVPARRWSNRFSPVTRRSTQRTSCPRRGD